MTAVVRRVRAHEWRRVRDLRLEAVSDPAAPIAFLHSYEEEAAHDDAFWQSRADGAADGDDVAQFVAESGEDWVGTLTVLRRAVGSVDHHGRPVASPRADVVGVYVRAGSRGEGTIEALFTVAADWVRSLGDRSLMLDVHADNHRAQAAYRRCGFTETGLRFTGSIGPELEMARALDADAVGERR